MIPESPKEIEELWKLLSDGNLVMHYNCLTFPGREKTAIVPDKRALSVPDWIAIVPERVFHEWRLAGRIVLVEKIDANTSLYCATPKLKGNK